MKRLMNCIYTYAFFVGMGALIRIGQRSIDDLWDGKLFTKEEEAEG